MSLDAHTASAPASDKSNPARAADRASQLRLVRKAATAALELSQAASVRREMLANLLGVRKGAADPVALVVALHEADPSAAAPVLSLLNIAGIEDQVDATVAAVELAADRDRARAIWALLTALKEVTGAIPAVPAKAGGAIAKAAKGLSPRSLTELRALRDLLR